MKTTGGTGLRRAFLHTVHRTFRRPDLAAVTGVALAAGVLAYLLSLGIQDWQLLADSNPPAASPVLSHPASSPIDHTALQQSALFGAAGPSPAPVREEAPETRLQLELRGIFRDSQADYSTALIADRGQPATLYGVGDRLPGGGTLYAVQESRILIHRHDRIEALSFASARTDSSVPRPPSQLETASALPSPSPRYESDAIKERLQQLRDLHQQQQP